MNVKKQDQAKTCVAVKFRGGTVYLTEMIVENDILTVMKVKSDI